MKNFLTLVLLLCFCYCASGQEDHLYFLETDTSWQKEAFVFPLSFAPEIAYQGREDARFPSGWSDAESPNFWSYVFAWNLEEAGVLTATDFENSLQKYFDGIMRWDATEVQISQQSTNGSRTTFTGIVQTKDGFFSQQPMNLNVRIEQHHCEEKNKTIILFRFSPKAFGTPTWELLKTVKPATIVAECGETKAKKIHDLLALSHEYERFNGSALVVERGEVIYEGGFGYANMEWKTPNTMDTKHRLASISKQFTAMLIVQLAAEGKLQLDRPITDYLPNYPKATGDRITVHHLLTHTGGIPNYTSFPNYREMMGKSYRPQELVDLFADMELEFDPGTSFAYSNSGYILLGVIIETLTGQTYEQVLQEKIFTPLEMDNSGYDHHDAILDKRATGYDRVLNEYRQAGYLDMSVPYAAGALYSTVEDLYRWDQALYTDQLLPDDYRALLFGTHAAAWGEHYGYGWEVGSMPVGEGKERVTTVAHSGGINGFNTRITRLPEERSVVILLNNTGGAPLYDMTAAILGILKEQPYILPRKSLAFSWLEMVQEEGLEAALTAYPEMKTDEKYYQFENEMNIVGYELMGTGSLEAAAAIFQLNVAAFPNAFNVYDSYGEALLAQGDTTRAIENYEQSVRLNPDNQNGIMVLEGLGVDVAKLATKVPVEHLRLLAGEYLAVDQDREWKIVIEESDGKLYGNDGGYRYQLNPVGNDKFINPDDGATIVFDASDKEAVTFVIFERVTFRKVK